MKRLKKRFARFFPLGIYQGSSCGETIKSEPRLNPLKSILFMGKWWGACNAPLRTGWLGIDVRAHCMRPDPGLHLSELPGLKNAA